ncbi:hypothetical protein GCM10027440_41950 [Nocardiopsis coralliicola]
MHVEQDQVGLEFADHPDRGVDVVRLADHVDGVAELLAHTAAEQPVVIDDHHARQAAAALAAGVRRVLVSIASVRHAVSPNPPKPQGDSTHP